MPDVYCEGRECIFNAGGQCHAEVLELYAVWADDYGISELYRGCEFETITETFKLGSKSLIKGEDWKVSYLNNVLFGFKQIVHALGFKR